MSIIAVALGENTGWAIATPDAVLSGFELFEDKNGDKGGIRFLRFIRWLDRFKSLNITEAYFTQSQTPKYLDDAYVMGGFLSHFQAWCEAHRMTYSGIDESSVKELFTGSVKPSKKKMAEVAKIEGFNTKDQNEILALALLKHAKFQELHSQS